MPLTLPFEINPKRKSRPTQVACCIKSAAMAVLEVGGQPGLLINAVTHKGPDLHCKNCSSLFVHYKNSRPVVAEGLANAGSTRSDPCTTMRVHDFDVLVSRCADESLKPNACKEDRYGDCSEGCMDEDALVIPEVSDCSGKAQGTLLDESMLIWADRELLETYLLKAIECCLARCGLKFRCSQLSIGEAQQETQGGCTTVTIPVQVKW